MKGDSYEAHDIIMRRSPALLLMYADDLVLLTTNELHSKSALEVLVTISSPPKQSPPSPPLQSSPSVDNSTHL